MNSFLAVRLLLRIFAAETDTPVRSVSEYPILTEINMKLKFALIAAAALMFGACSGSKTQEAEAQAEEPATEEINILGTWNI